MRFHDFLFSRKNMNEEIVAQLVDMGFPINACKRAVYFSNNDLEAAMNWLCSNIDDPDYNTGKGCRTGTFLVSAGPGPKIASLLCV